MRACARRTVSRAAASLTNCEAVAKLIAHQGPHALDALARLAALRQHLERARVGLERPGQVGGLEQAVAGGDVLARQEGLLLALDLQALGILRQGILGARPTRPIRSGLAKLAGSASTGGSVSASATRTGAAASASWTVASASVSGSEERQESAMAKASVETRSELGRMFFTDRCVRLRWDGWGRPGDGGCGRRATASPRGGRSTDSPERGVAPGVAIPRRGFSAAGSIPAPPAGQRGSTRAEPSISGETPRERAYPGDPRELPPVRGCAGS